MNLAHIKYKYKDGRVADMMLLLLSDDVEDYVVGLKSSMLSQHETELIRRNVEILEPLNFNRRKAWFKNNITSYSKCFRRLDSQDAKIQNLYELEPIK